MSHNRNFLVRGRQFGLGSSAALRLRYRDRGSGNAICDEEKSRFSPPPVRGAHPRRAGARARRRQPRAVEFAAGAHLGPLYLWRRTLPRSGRSEEHTSELQSLMRISYAVFCLKKKKISIEYKRTQDINNKK